MATRSAYCRVRSGPDGIARRGRSRSWFSRVSRLELGTRNATIVTLCHVPQALNVSFRKIFAEGTRRTRNRVEADYLQDGREPEQTRSTDLSRPDRHRLLCWRVFGGQKTG